MKWGVCMCSVLKMWSSHRSYRPRNHCVKLFQTVCLTGKFCSYLAHTLQLFLNLKESLQQWCLPADHLYLLVVLKFRMSKDHFIIISGQVLERIDQEGWSHLLFLNQYFLIPAIQWQQLRPSQKTRRKLFDTLMDIFHTFFYTLTIVFHSFKQRKLQNVLVGRIEETVVCMKRWIGEDWGIIMFRVMT